MASEGSPTLLTPDYLDDHEDDASMASRAHTFGPNPTEQYPAQLMGWVPFTQTENGRLELVDLKTNKPFRAAAEKGEIVPCTKPLCPKCSTVLFENPCSYPAAVARHLIAESQKIETKEGWLEKLGGKLRPVWQDRFFIANERALYYYAIEPGTQQEKQKPKGSKKFLNKGKVVVRVVEKPEHKECADPTHHYFALEFQFPPHTVYFRSTKEDVVAKWVAFLKETVETLKKDQRVEHPARYKSTVSALLTELDQGLTTQLEYQKRLEDTKSKFHDLCHQLDSISSRQSGIHFALQERHGNFTSFVGIRKAKNVALEEVKKAREEVHQTYHATNAQMRALQQDVDCVISDAESREQEWNQMKQQRSLELESCRAEIEMLKKRYKELFQKTRKAEERPWGEVEHAALLKESTMCTPTELLQTLQLERTVKEDDVLELEEDDFLTFLRP